MKVSQILHQSPDERDVTFSIIVPLKEINDYVRENVDAILKLRRSDWELLIVTNEPTDSEWPNESRIQMLSSGRVGPAEKRDLAARVAIGEYLVFLDDDSYPEDDLLDIALSKFNEGHLALGGPAVTPESNSYRQKVSGAVFSSRLTGGRPERYRSLGSERLVDDWPSVNLMVKKSVFLEVNGFDSPYWPGEDTFLCLKLLRRKVRVLYVPSMIVWHHRREGFFRHLKQVGAYGLHRGYFARHLPDTSRRLTYFLPSGVLALHLMVLVSLPLLGWWLNPFLVAETLYMATIFVGVLDMSRHQSPTVAIGAIPYVVGTHVAYGFYFVKGFVMRGQLVSKLR